METKRSKAIFAGGYSWCMEPPFEKLDSLRCVISGYTGGDKENPTCQEVCEGTTGHTEAIGISYGPNLISSDQLLAAFWMNIDPANAIGQFIDRGSQYRTGMFSLDDKQKRLAEASKERLAMSGRYDSPIVTEIPAASAFYPAEGYYRQNPDRDNGYRDNSDRDRHLKHAWRKDKE